MRESDQCFTPPELFEQLGLRFDLDVASPAGGVPWVPCDRYLTEADDGLTAEWHGRVWMNPPYSKPAPWVERFTQHGNGVALLPISKSRWFRDLWGRADVRLVFPAPYLKFIKDDKPHSIYMPVIFAAMGKECCRAIAKHGRLR